MAEIPVKDIGNRGAGSLSVDDSVLTEEFNQDVLYEVVKMQQANRRRGTASTKTRGQVTGSTRKLYRQKGTGRARKGDIKSPVLRGGGIVFGPHPRDYSYRVPRTVRRKALRVALSEYHRQGRLHVVESFELPEPKTKAAVEAVRRGLGLTGRVLIVDVDNPTLKLCTRNVPDIGYLDAKGLNVYDLLLCDELVVTRGSFNRIEEVCKK